MRAADARRHQRRSHADQPAPRRNPQRVAHVRMKRHERHRIHLRVQRDQLVCSRRPRQRVSRRESRRRSHSAHGQTQQHKNARESARAARPWPSAPRCLAPRSLTVIASTTRIFSPATNVISPMKMRRDQFLQPQRPEQRAVFVHPGGGHDSPARPRAEASRPSARRLSTSAMRNSSTLTTSPTPARFCAAPAPRIPSWRRSRKSPNRKFPRGGSAASAAPIRTASAAPRADQRHVIADLQPQFVRQHLPDHDGVEAVGVGREIRRARKQCAATPRCAWLPAPDRFPSAPRPARGLPEDSSTVR